MKITTQDIENIADRFHNELDAVEAETGEKVSGTGAFVPMLEGVGVENAEELADEALRRWGPLVGTITLTGIATGLALSQQVEA